MSSQETEPQSGGGEPSGVLSDATWLDRQWLWALVGLSVLGLLLRAFLLDGQSLWLDEGYTLRHAGHPASFGDLVQFGPQESPSPPLYYVLLHLWLRVTGVTPMAGRAFSVVCGSLTVPAFAVLLRPLIGARTALSSSLLLAVSPLHIYYSQETRPYAPMLLFFILSTHCLSRALQTRRAGTWFLHWLTTTVCVYMHYTGGAVILGQGLYLLVSWRADKRPIPRAGIGCLAGAAGAAAAWALGPRFFSTMGTLLGSDESPAAAVARLPWVLLRLVWDVQFGYFPGLGQAPLAALVTLLVFSPALFVLSLLTWRRLLAGPHKDAARLLVSLIVGALVVGIGIVVGTAFRDTRYFLSVLPAALAIESLAIRDLWRSRLRPVGVATGLVLAALTTMSLWGYYFNPQCARSDWRSLAAVLDEGIESGDEVVLPAYYYDAPLQTYYARDTQIFALDPARERSPQIRDHFRQCPLPPGGSYWVVEVDPKDATDLAELGEVTARDFHRLRLVRLRPSAMR